jgi:hypothetical protein
MAAEVEIETASKLAKTTNYATNDLAPFNYLI